MQNRIDLKSLRVGDMVKVVKNIDNSQYDFLVGKVGFVTKINEFTADVQFEHDEEWATPEYTAHYSEIELEEKSHV